jgi:hypothetical protein
VREVKNVRETSLEIIQSDSCFYKRVDYAGEVK